MCGRFAFFATPDDILELLFRLRLSEPVEPRYNIAPSQNIPTVLNDETRKVVFTRWGLIPSWAKDPSIGNKLINARAETLSEKPSFRSSIRRKRCVILASGFYEWKTIPGRKAKAPYFIHLKSGKPFAFAGLWNRWEDGQGSEMVSSAIITTSPNSLLASIHNRMPVILHPDCFDLWLSPDEQTPEKLFPLLKPYPAKDIEAYAVSTLINSPNHDTPECITPVTSL